jgi:hypothetical protein
MKHLLWIVHVSQLGRGDFDILMKLSNSGYLSGLGLDEKQVTHTRIVLINSANTTLSLAELNRTPGIIVIPYQITHAPFDPQVVEAFKKALQSNNGLVGQIAQADCLFSISYAPPAELYKVLELYLKKKPIDNYCIGEHGARSFDKLFLKPKKTLFPAANTVLPSINHVPVHLGVENGFLLHDVVSSHDLNVKAKSLADIDDKPYLCRLFKCDEKQLSQEKAKQFLQDNLLVPGYMQDTAGRYVFIQSVACSEIAKSYKSSVTFHVNNWQELQIPEKFIKSLDVKALVAAGFAAVEINEKLFPLTSSDNSAAAAMQTAPQKTLRIISNHLIKNDKSYEAIYAAAQFIAGCSGDNTLQLVLSKGLVPFYQPRLWKLDFIEKFILYIKSIKMNQFGNESLPAILNILKMIPADTMDYDGLKLRAAEIANMLNAKQVADIHKLVRFIQSDKNFDVVLKYILLKQGLISNPVPGFKK